MTIGDDVADNIERLKEIEGTLPDPYLPPGLATSFFEDAPDAKIVVDLETRKIRFANRRAEFLFGYHRTELVGRPVEVLVPEALRARHKWATEAYRAEPRQRPMGSGQVLSGRHKSGRDVPAHIMLSPVSVPEGQFVLATIRPFVAKAEPPHDESAATQQG